MTPHFKHGMIKKPIEIGWLFKGCVLIGELVDMTVVTLKDVVRAVKELGVTQGDIVLVHSSLKSMGHVEGGAETVIGGFMEAVGADGTLVMPTLSQKDVRDITRQYRNPEGCWPHRDKSQAGPEGEAP